jgi:sulfur carrier protein
MLIKVNGLDREVPDNSSVLDLLEHLQLAPDKVAIEVNRKLVRTASYSRPLTPGDQVEIVTFVGGG